MLRVCRLLLAVLVGLAAVACGDPSPTLPASSVSAPASAAPSTAALVTPTVAPASPTAPVASPSAPVASPTPPDADALFDLALAEGPAWKSFHLKLALSGSFKASFLRALGDPDYARRTANLSLAGVVLEGNLDATTLAAHLALRVPAAAARSRRPVTVDMIIKDPLLYLKTSSLGPKYRETKLGTMLRTLGLSVAIPAPGPKAQAGIAKSVGSFRTQLEQAGVTARLVGMDTIGGKDAYRIELALPLAKMSHDLDSALAKAGARRLAKTTIGAASAEIWIYATTYELAQVRISVRSSTIGSISMLATLTNFDVPVVIKAPRAKDVLVIR